MLRSLRFIFPLVCLALFAWFPPAVRNPHNLVDAFPASVAATEGESSFRIRTANYVPVTDDPSNNAPDTRMLYRYLRHFNRRENLL
jgi:hypothetical protein